MPFSAISQNQVQRSSSPACALAPRSASSSNYAPSISSVISNASTLRPEAHQQRGFKSRESYLAALNEFADQHLYMQSSEHTLKGFYGEKTMEEIKAKPSLMEERRKRKAREARDREKFQRRETLAGLPESVDEGAVSALQDTQSVSNNSNAEVDIAVVEQKEGRIRRLSRVLTGGRRSTVA